jgi:hypothetical protein
VIAGDYKNVGSDINSTVQYSTSRDRMEVEEI